MMMAIYHPVMLCYLGKLNRHRKGLGMEQLFQVWDYKRNEPQSFHGTKQEAEEEASRLNANQAMDWNGLQRYIVMEAND